MHISLTGLKSCATNIVYMLKFCMQYCVTQPPEDMIKKILTYLTLLAAGWRAGCSSYQQTNAKHERNQ
jgi:hypothetical protein